MARDPRYDILFEPVQIGPVTAKNRFYQVPHCNGMGRNYPTEMAVMRGNKAEGGWSVICTEQCDIHPTSETRREVRLWDDQDIPYLARMTDQVHRHGALAGIELVHMGFYGANHFSREPLMAPSATPPKDDVPGFARAMDKEDIRAVRRWHRNAALRAREAGFDIVVCYAGHDIALAMHFLGRRYNQRTDEYGGSLENRVRLLRELIEETKEAVGDTCGVALRFAVDEVMGPDGLVAEEEGRDIVAMLAELPDLWDVNCSDWKNDSITSRFAEEGFQEPFIGFVKGLTSKPVVGVGRYTSPDRMVSLINKGVLDMIGAARPSIADPFLPKKIEEGRLEDIRECIGCNICVGTANQMTPMRCTQNPTMGEEWRRGWHPERIPAKESDDRILVVGAGPAGLEATRALGQRGYEVLLAEAGQELGGRVLQESRLPGLSAWGRVRDYRVGQINQMANVEVYRDSEMTAESVLEAGCRRVVLATGANWRKDGFGRTHKTPLPGLDSIKLYSPDDIMAGAKPEGPVVVYDDDYFYMASLMAEVLAAQGLSVTFVTPGAVVAPWSDYTLEQSRIQKALIKAGVEIVPLHAISQFEDGAVRLSCVYSGKEKRIEAASAVLVTTLWPQDQLFQDLQTQEAIWMDQGVSQVVRVGDCYAPSTIAAAVWSGHKYARTLGVEEIDGVAFHRENIALGALD